MDNENTLRDELISTHSDAFKEVYGFRPRADFSAFSVAEIEAEVEAVLREARYAFAEEAERRHRAESARPVTSGPGWAFVPAD